MNKMVRTVAKFEIIRQLKKPAFWAAILIMPIMLGVVFLIGLLSGESGADTNPALDENTTIAITDEAGILNPGLPYLTAASEEEGREMVKNGEIDLYYYIPADFAETKTAEFYHISEGLDLFNYDANILKGILKADASNRVDALDFLALSGESEITDNKLTAAGEEENAIGKMVVPLAILVLFFLFIALFGNRFLLATVEEKENRVSEMILTAVSSKHLIVGKILAMMALGVIQILTVVIPAVILIIINRENSIVSYVLSAAEFDPVIIAMNIVLFIAAILFYAGTCTFIGSLVSTARDASSFIGPAIVAMVFPLYFMQLFFAAEPSALVYFLTYFPLSAPIALMLRSAFGTLGTFEFIAGVLEVTILAALMIRLAVITFQKNAINFTGITRRNRKV